MNTPLSLVVLAAWMWSRYGWLKQIDEFGPAGQSLLEYAVYDAVRAGFSHIVLVIRQEFKQAFCEKFTDMLESIPSYAFVYQTVDPARDKPRWTLDATVCAQNAVSWAFAVVNADDRYGTQSYALIADSLRTIQSNQAYLVGYTLQNTLSDYGTVNRGVCSMDSINGLKDVTERYAIAKRWDCIIDRDWNEFSGTETVSMNFWGFHQDFFEQSSALLQQFKHRYKGTLNAEMVIPDAVDSCVRSGILDCRVLDSQDPRQGVTNAEDKWRVAKAFDQMHNDWVYPKDLRK